MQPFRAFLCGLAVFASVTIARPEPVPPASPANAVRALLDADPADLTFAEAKIQIDAAIDPSIDAPALRAAIIRLTNAAERIVEASGGEASDMERLQAIRTVLHTAGAWNDMRPFAYDLDDPFGQKPGAQSLGRYLSTRKGNCVSMPVLFLALGERLGLDLTLSTAPLHVFVRFLQRRKD